MGGDMAGKTQRQRRNTGKEARRGPGRLPHTLTDRFTRFAQTVAHAAGHPASFLVALVLIVTWVLCGPLFQYSDTWQLVVNTGTTIVTFLMVFLIQNTQNRDSMAVQLKLSELVLASKDVEDKYAAIEDLSDEELEELHDECRARAEMTLTHLQRRRARRGHNGEQRTRAPAQRTQSSRHGS